ncbi:MAG: TonB-dependent receptor, partial [Prevotellaceae bacterium]|nr:TonB-dependent receptor [Prevotellaceae bacterium]
MKHRINLLVSLSLLVSSVGFAQQQDSIQGAHKDFQRENSFELSSIDESTQDENADLAGQNFSTLATFSNDPFLSEVGYQLSGFRFSPRGYKNKYGQTYLNGIEFNSQIRGGFNYSMIGGMNDATRNATTTDYLQAGLFSFGDLAGAQNYDLRAGSYARGTKVTLTYTNRNYQQRAMLSHHTGLNRKGWAFSALIGGRYANEGVVEGTFYHNLSYFLGVEKQWANGRHSLSLTTFGSPVQRAQQSASVQEAYTLTGNNLYNSYWGYMPDGGKRNQRVVTSYTPTLLLSHIWKIDRTSKLTTGFGISYNRYGSTALNWFNNAADPRPDYYRYLPSYTSKTYNTDDPNYIADARFWTGSGKGNDRGKSQIAWGDIYEANLNNNLYGANKSALYIIEERRNDAFEKNFNTTFEKKLSEEITLVAGVGARHTLGKTFDVVADLLGANYLVDIDKYGERDFQGNNVIKQNDLNNPDREVKKGDIFGYHYHMNASSGNFWAQMHHNYEYWEFFYAAKLTASSFYRDGKMKNGRDTLTSFGKGQTHPFIDPAVKAGVVYKLDGRNLFSLNGMFKTQAPLPYDAYTKPRISDEAVPDLSSEQITSADFNYVFTYPKINGRISGFYTDYRNGASKISYYNDSYRTFVHHSLSGVNKRNYGAEAAVKYNFIKNFTLSFAGTWSDFRYTNNPQGTIRYENGAEKNFSAAEQANLAERVAIEDFHVGGSPEIAGSIGLQYFWKFWWFEVNVNGIANNYLDPSSIQRTASFKEKVFNALYNDAMTTPVEQGGAGGDDA